jgi:hypothetical protein
MTATHTFLCGFAPLREIILEARITENVAKLLEDTP